MQWQKRYLQASFKGVEFYANSHSLKVGRKQVKHDFVYVDGAYIEDMGRKQREYNLTCYITAEDYFKHRNELIALFEKAGEGLLIHPYLGAINATLIDDVSFTESKDKQNVVFFNLKFVESKKNELTLESTSAKDNVIENNTETFDACKSQLEKTYDTGITIADIIIATNEAVETSFNAIVTARQTLSGNSIYNGYANAYIGTIATLTQQTDLLFEAVYDLLTFGTNYQDENFVDEGAEQFAEIKSIINTVNETTASTANEEVFNTLLLNVCIAVLNNIATSIDYKSQDELLAYKLIIFDLIANVQDNETTVDAVYSALEDNKKTLETFYTENYADLKSEVYYSIKQQSENSLALAYLLYGTLDNEQQILDKNNIQSPFFISDKIKVIL